MNLPSHMRAVRLMTVGQPLEEIEIPLPSPGAHEVLVRVEAAGICHSDVHYRAGTGTVTRLPITPGHEVAGTVVATGQGSNETLLGKRVALHYLATCGHCLHCAAGREQFCPEARMLGKDMDGGYAEYLCVPARNAVPIPDEVSMEAAAVMMCSTATAFHALNKARMRAGDRVAVFGVGGLGMSAVQLARIAGASQIFAIDLDAGKLEMARSLGALPIHPEQGPVVAQLRDATEGQGVDVALELAGVPITQQQAVQVLAVQGRAALAAISSRPFELHAFTDVIGREAEIIGVSDHLLGELPLLMKFAAAGQLDLDRLISDHLPLEAEAINARLDALARFCGPIRSVIRPLG